jgi:alkylhydroperoxidase family enzyme
LARVPYLEVEGYPPLHTFQALAHSPQLLESLRAVGRILLYESTLDAHARELAIVAVAAKLRSAYQWSQHVGMAREAGVTDGELRAVRDGNLDALQQPARACVAYALKVEDRTVTDHDVDELRALGLTNQHIVELTVLAAIYGMSARYITALDIEVDEGAPGFDIP